MKIYTDIQQGTEEWQALRRGKITGSGAAALMTDPRSTAAKAAGGMSEAAMTYLYCLLAEILVEPNGKNYSNAAMDWGHEYEDKAVMLYSALNSVMPEKIGFVEYNDWIGVSPDRLIGEDGGIEIKCPYEAKVHISYLELETPADLKSECKEYYWQVLFNLWLTGRKWWDFVSFDPRLREPFQLKTIRFDADTFSDELKHLEQRTLKAAAWLQQKMIQYL